MSLGSDSSPRPEPEPLPDNLTSVQPGGGVCYQIELTWGVVRRAWLKTFRAAYVRRMAELRQGDADGAPHDLLDPRDLKYCRNLTTAHWRVEDDPFQWRERLWLARWGLAELLLMGVPLAVATLALATTWAWPLASLPLVVLLWLVWFFRDPPRRVPDEPGVIVAPADGRVCEISRVEHDEFLGGPAIKIGIFLSIFNVHLNRAPARGRVLRLRYWPGKFLNALNPASAWLNESLTIGFEESEPPHRRFVVRQIAGLFARRIVCALRPGEIVERGAKFGMIKLGSRTELLLPEVPNLEIITQVGENLAAGRTIMARWPT